MAIVDVSTWHGEPMIIRLLLRLLLIMLLIVLLQKIWRSLTTSVHRDGGLPPEAPKNPGSEPMVLDPQCGTYIPRNDAITAPCAGHSLHFCSRECRDAYLARNR